MLCQLVLSENHCQNWCFHFIKAMNKFHFNKTAAMLNDIFRNNNLNISLVDLFTNFNETGLLAKEK